jgi:hypothetical protein
MNLSPKDAELLARIMAGFGGQLQAQPAGIRLMPEAAPPASFDDFANVRGSVNGIGGGPGVALPPSPVMPRGDMGGPQPPAPPIIEDRASRAGFTPPSPEMFGKIPMPPEFAGMSIGLGPDGFYDRDKMGQGSAVATNDAPMQQPQAAPGGGMFGDEFKARLGDWLTGLGMGAGGTWQDSLAGGAKMVAAGKLSRGEKKELAKNANRTAEWAIGQGVDPGTVEAYLGAGDAKGLIDYVQKVNEGTKPTADIQEYEFAKSQGYGGSWVDYQKELKAAGSTKIENNIGDNGVKYPDPPSGYDYMRGPDGRPVIEGGLPKLAPIPGGDAYSKRQAAEAKEAAGQGKTAKTGGIVVEDIDRALKLVETATLPTTGMTGNVMSNIGGTAANDIRTLMDTVKANTGFAELSAMRAASPTGGALGSVTERELALLTSTMGNLEQSQTKEQFVRNLTRLRELYLDTIHGPGNRPDAAKPAAGGVIDASDYFKD